MTEPTARGAEKYPDQPIGYYCANEMPGDPCTCKDACTGYCKGACGCLACHNAYADFQSDDR